MGQAFSALADINPLSVAKNISHDLSVYVFNERKSDCSFCDRWKFGFTTYETYDDASSDDGTSINIQWNH